MSGRPPYGPPPPGPPHWTPPPPGYGPGPHQKKGSNTPVIIAVVVGVVLVGVAVAGIVAAIAIPSLLAARRASNESSAIGILRSFGSAEALYMAENGEFASIEDLQDEGFLDSLYSDGAVIDGYRFTLVRADGYEFEIKAEPEKPANGSRSFNITEDYTIRYKDGPVAPRGKAGKEIGVR